MVLTVKVSMDGAEADLQLDEETQLIPVGPFCAKIAAHDDFPAEMRSGIETAGGVLTMQVRLGPSTFMEVTELSNTYFGGKSELSIAEVAQGGNLNVRIAKPAGVAMKVISPTGEPAGYINVPPNATRGLELVEIISSLYSGDMPNLCLEAWRPPPSRAPSG